MECEATKHLISNYLRLKQEYLSLTKLYTNITRKSLRILRLNLILHVFYQHMGTCNAMEPSTCNLLRKREEFNESKENRQYL